MNDKIPLNEHNIKDDAVDSTIGSMVNFFKDNLDILLPNLSCAAKEYIREEIFDFKDLRNGYFHKHNIHSLEKIKEICNETFLIIFLLLGLHSLSDENKTSLGMPAIENFNDYARLCEYVNYHANEVFFINIDGEQETILLACSDLNSKVIDESYIKYSGAYFKNLGKNSRQYNTLSKKIVYPMRYTLENLCLHNQRKLKLILIR